jgi:hypothetical protein
VHEHFHAHAVVTSRTIRDLSQNRLGVLLGVFDEADAQVLKIRGARRVIDARARRRNGGVEYA